MFPGTIYVGRPSKWGNPFKVGEIVPQELIQYLRFPGEPDRLAGLSSVRIVSAERVVETFSWWIIEQPYLMLSLDELRGHNLACWCGVWYNNGERIPCHADILLELANEGYKTPACREEMP